MKNIVVQILGLMAGWLVPANPAMLALSAAPAVLNFLGNQFGKNSYKKDPMYGTLSDIYERKMAESEKPFSQTTGFLAPLAQIRENQREASRVAANSMAQGGTAESQVALQGQINKNTATSITQLLGMGPEYKDRQFAGAMQAFGGMQNIKGGYDQRRMGSAANMGTNMAGVLGNLYSGGAFDGGSLT